MSHAFICMVNNLTHLTHLRIDDTTGVSFVAYIFQNLTLLESLMIHRMVIGRETGEEGDYFDSKTIQSCRLKSLDISWIMSFDEKYSQLDKINDLFGFILMSCLLLEYFLLNGIIRLPQPGVLYLNFHRNPRMKLINIDLRGCSYYILNRSEERWAYYKGYKGIKKKS